MTSNQLDHKLNTSQALVVFDLDGTLLYGNSSFAFSRYLYKKNIFTSFDLLFCLGMAILYKYFGLSLTTLHHLVFNRLFKNKPINQFIEEAKLFAPTLSSQFNSTVLQRLQDATSQGAHILILSSSPQFLVTPLLESLNIKSFATNYEVDKEGVICKIALLIDGNKKAQIVKEFMRMHRIDRNQLSSYSDHIDDLPLLELSSHVSVVNPGRKLKKRAKLKGWEIL